MNKWYRLMANDENTYIMATAHGVWLRYTAGYNSTTSVFINGATLKDFGFTVDLVKDDE